MIILGTDTGIEKASTAQSSCETYATNSLTTYQTVTEQKRSLLR